MLEVYLTPLEGKQIRRIGYNQLVFLDFLALSGLFTVWCERVRLRLAVA